MRKKNGKPKVERPLEELVEALRRHVRVLDAYATIAFGEQQGDHQDDFLGEVAGKLRLLVGDRGNEPLLLRLMQELDLEVPVLLVGSPTIRPDGEPGAGDRVTLRKFFRSQAYGTVTLPDPFAESYLLLVRGLGLLPTRDDFIHVWAQQQGSAHEDWKVDEAFVNFRDAKVFGGQSPMVPELGLITATVVYVAERVLAQATPDRIAKAEARRQGRSARTQ